MIRAALVQCDGRRVQRKRLSVMQSRQLRIVIFGPPGGGKGTQSAKLERDYNLKPISSGHLLRTSVEIGDEVGKAVEPLLNEGKLVGDELMIKVIKNVFENDPEMAKDNWILDGFPRTLAQAESLDGILQNNPLDAALFLDVPSDVIMERLGNRRVHPESGRTYHLSYNPPKVPGKDDVTGETLITRDDDTPESISKRLAIYEEQTKPLYTYFEKKGILHNIPSPNSDVGYEHMKKLMDKLKQ
eukprot:TRINITY_DN1887_c0_g1_i1.p1 TRINITY_DN1887_c0_g1~~TRINITY_DN1887_c0_g1_i1.p1  ORF type:complete len:243 (-),score=65.46 TRINITY_DN1887_c0_g1_i1:135-863(-)